MKSYLHLQRNCSWSSCIVGVLIPCTYAVVIVYTTRYDTSILLLSGRSYVQLIVHYDQVVLCCIPGVSWSTLYIFCNTGNEVFWFCLHSLVQFSAGVVVIAFCVMIWYILLRLGWILLCGKQRNYPRYMSLICHVRSRLMTRISFVDF